MKITRYGENYTLHSRQIAKQKWQSKRQSDANKLRQNPSRHKLENWNVQQTHKASLTSETATTESIKDKRNRTRLKNLRRNEAEHQTKQHNLIIFDWSYGNSKLTDYRKASTRKRSDTPTHQAKRTHIRTPMHRTPNTQWNNTSDNPTAEKRKQRNGTYTRKLPVTDNIQQKPCVT